MHEPQPAYARFKPSSEPPIRSAHLSVIQIPVTFRRDFRTDNNPRKKKTGGDGGGLGVLAAAAGVEAAAGSAEPPAKTTTGSVPTWGDLFDWLLEKHGVVGVAMFVRAPVASAEAVGMEDVDNDTSKPAQRRSSVASHLLGRASSCRGLKDDSMSAAAAATAATAATEQAPPFPTAADAGIAYRMYVVTNPSRSQLLRGTESIFALLSPKAMKSDELKRVHGPAVFTPRPGLAARASSVSGDGQRWGASLVAKPMSTDGRPAPVLVPEPPPEELSVMPVPTPPASPPPALPEQAEDLREELRRLTDALAGERARTNELVALLQRAVGGGAIAVDHGPRQPPPS